MPGKRSVQYAKIEKFSQTSCSIPIISVFLYCNMCKSINYLLFVIVYVA